MGLEIKRLHLASLTGPGGDRGRWPVHGFAVIHPGGAVLVDTGVGGPQDVLDDWQVVNVAAADALADHGLSPADITLVINTHLHFDHCGQNAVFKHAPFYVQRTELARARREASDLADWFDFAGARFELLDGDAEILPGLSVVTTPGHTAGHQSVLVDTGDGAQELLIGDAAYTSREFQGPLDQELPPGQAADHPSWATSVGRLRTLAPSRVHFCHDTAIGHG
jgi:N-acyl homoserine lactone hydrolase